MEKTEPEPDTAACAGIGRLSQQKFQPHRFQPVSLYARIRLGLRHQRRRRQAERIAHRYESVAGCRGCRDSPLHRPRRRDRTRGIRGAGTRRRCRTYRLHVLDPYRHARCHRRSRARGRRVGHRLHLQSRYSGTPRQYRRCRLRGEHQLRAAAVARPRPGVALRRERGELGGRQTERDRHPVSLCRRLLGGVSVRQGRVVSGTLGGRRPACGGRKGLRGNFPSGTTL